MQYQYTPVKITSAQAQTLLSNANSNADSHFLFHCYRPLGLYYLTEKEKHIGIDNSTGDAWTEEFDTIQDCLRWLYRTGCLRRDGEEGTKKEEAAERTNVKSN